MKAKKLTDKDREKLKTMTCVNTELEKKAEAKKRPIYDYPLQESLRKWMEMVIAMASTMDTDRHYRYPVEDKNELIP